MPMQNSSLTSWDLFLRPVWHPVGARVPSHRVVKITCSFPPILTAISSVSIVSDSWQPSEAR